MAVKLRLVRMGKKKQPTYRVVAADSRSPRDGRFLEIVGTYAPRGASTAEPDAVIKIDNEKAVKWLVNGAQPTERVARFLGNAGLMAKPEMHETPQKSAPKKKAQERAKAAAEAAGAVAGN